MSDKPEPLEPDILGLLHAAKAPAPVDAAARARVLAGVEARIAALPSGRRRRKSRWRKRGRWRRRLRPAELGHRRATGLGKLLASRPLASIALALAVGGVGRRAPSRRARAPGRLRRSRGAGDRRVDRADERVDRRAPIAAETKAPPTAIAMDPRRGPSRPTRSRARARPPHPSAAPLDSGAALAAESALLDIARTALARGEPDHALAAVGRHASQFPHGLLAEEREALAVKALAQSGRAADAHARANRFRARYPESLFSTAIDSSLKDVREMDSPRSPQP